MSELPPAEKPSRFVIALIAVIILAAIALGIGSAMSPDVEAAIEPWIPLLVAIGFGAYAVGNTGRALVAFSERRYGWCVFWALVALVMALVALSALLYTFAH